jgi:hypothetical protein
LINIQNILTVSKYERKTLFRSWFFRIFSIISLLQLFGTNMGLFGFYGGIQWTPRAIASNLPYTNVLFINVAQAIIAVFLASDFLKRDKKLDTTEVIYTRPISNGEYVVGKTTGILTLFIGLVVSALLISLVFNLTKQDVPIVWKAYLYYPLLITVPTLLFILGLSFLLMIIIKNQAVTFVILLGYIGLSLFFLRDKVHGALDYMAFNLPMIYSDFIGFGEPDRIILHRLAYLLLGVGFIFATIRYLNRLPQVGRWNAINVIAFVTFVAVGGLTGYRYYSIYHKEDTERMAYLSLNNSYASTPTVDIVSNDLVLEQQGRRLKISSDMQLRNTNTQKLDTLIFSLNPGFKVDSIISENQSVDFIRDRQILKIISKEGLASRLRLNLSIYYSGIPLESIAYLDIPDEILQERKRIRVATVDKKPGIIHRDFLLLTPELIWYPTAGVKFNNINYLPGDIDFVSYTLKVSPNSGLTAVAPGEVEVSGSDMIFTPDSDLNALSLVIGPFEKHSLRVEDVDYNLFIMPEHDFFSEYFTHISDTIADLIIEEKEDYEIEDLDLYYPFNRINLVEVPIQFHAYERPQVQIFETIQPEMILLPEKGAGINSIDFSRYQFYEERRNRKENEARTPEEIEVNLFKRFLSSTFFSSMPRTRPVSYNRRMGGENLITFQGVTYEKNPFCVFPLYYSYMTGVSSTEFPLFNSMLEIYLGEGFAASMRQTFRGGMSDNEMANRALMENSVNEIFADWDNAITSALISQMGSFVFLALKNRVGLSEFDNFLYYYLEDNAFREITFEQFSADFYREFDVKIEPYFETITSSGKIPSFIMSTPEYIQTTDDIGEVYLVRFKMKNTGEVKGLVDVSFMLANSMGMGPSSANGEQRLYEIDPGVTKEIQVSLFEQPRMMTVNTLISANIPSTFSTFLRSAEIIKSTDMEEYDRVSEDEFTLELPGEFIVDNEDPGFHSEYVSHESKLKKYIDSRKVKSNEVYYGSVDPYHIPINWSPVAHTAYYGASIRSALITRSGIGSSVASWTTVLPSAGFYDVYVFIPKSAMVGSPDRGRSRGGSSRSSGGGRGMGPSFADERTIYNYTISSNEGTEDVEFRLRNTEEGWNRVGAFHFPADTARIELSNITNGKRVFADAVKWVQR